MSSTRTRLTLATTSRHAAATVLLLALICATGLPLRGQEGPDQGRKQARAARLAGNTIQLDGRLDEEAWILAAPITDFTQAEPIEGAPPTDAMEVRFLYDNNALWVGARMPHSPDSPIRAQMSRRDVEGQAEYLQIELDSYLDRRTAAMFGVTAAGVRMDHYHASDTEARADANFDPVWQARTTVDAEGWTAEMWLPFSQLRFNTVPEQVWGLNIKWYRPDLEEEVYWVVIGRTAQGWASRFGDLRGIEVVDPPRRLEVLPYVAASSRAVASRDPANPFVSALNPSQRVGVDLKLGVGPNLTLEATINPDFGQVEADPAEVNLTALETFFTERRPFFLEGNQLLQGPINSYFYSRRIGARPSTDVDGDYVDYPEAATILGAAKLTGRLNSGMSLGFLAAVTGREEAEVSTGGLFSRSEIASRTLWGVARVEQEFGERGSTAGIQGTYVHRDQDPNSPLAALEVRNAFTFAADTQLLFGDRTYEADLTLGLSRIEGEPAAVERVQRSGRHRFQRPDQFRLDPTRRSMSGGELRGRLAKVSGRHWLWNTSVNIQTPEFETNDIGRLNSAGDVMLNGTLQYRETQPGPRLRAYGFRFSTRTVSPYFNLRDTRATLGATANTTLRNFWFAEVEAQRLLRGQDILLTRGGPSMETLQGWNFNGIVRNSNASLTRWNTRATYRRMEGGDREQGVSGSLTIRPAPAWQLSIRPEYSNEVYGQQYVTTLDEGSALTYGKRYVFGVIDRTTTSMQIRVDYTFRPDLTLEFYAEPFAASGRYERFGELAAPRTRHLRIYGENGIDLVRGDDGSYVVTDAGQTFTLNNRDFNVRSYRSNAVLRWEWRPGSTLFVVWQQNRESEDPYGDRVGPRDLFGAFSAPGDNIVAVKASWWFSS